MSFARGLKFKSTNQFWVSQTRYYNSLSVNVNEFDPAAKTTTKSSSIHDSTRKAPLSPALRKIVTRDHHYNQLMGERLAVLKQHLGKEFRLSDELLLKSLFSFSLDHIEFKTDQSNRTLVDIRSINKLGGDLLRLQKNLYLIENFADTYEDPSSILNENIADIMNRTGTFQSFMAKQNIHKAAIATNFLLHDQKENTVKTIKTIIGLIAYQYNTEKAIDFINQRIIRGNRGLARMVLERLNM